MPATRHVELGISPGDPHILFLQQILPGPMFEWAFAYVGIAWHFQPAVPLPRLRFDCSAGSKPLDLCHKLGIDRMVDKIHSKPYSLQIALDLQHRRRHLSETPARIEFGQRLLNCWAFPVEEMFYWQHISIHCDTPVQRHTLLHRKIFQENWR